MDQELYRNFFRGLAANNKAIGNNPDKDDRYFEVIRSFDPVSLVYDADFVAGVRSRMNLKEGACIMVLEYLESRWTDRGGDNKELMPTGAFIVLKRSNNENTKRIPAEIAKCLKETQLVAEQILAYTEEHNFRAWHSGNMTNSLFLEINEAAFFPVGPLESNIFGTRCEFTFRTPRNQAIMYDAQYWNTPIDPEPDDVPEP